MKRKCKYCDGSMEGKMPRAKFCSGTCRANYFYAKGGRSTPPNSNDKEHNEESSPSKKPVQALKGVIDDQPITPQPEKQPNPVYQKLGKLVKRCESIRAKLLQQKEHLLRKRQEVQKTHSWLLPTVGMLSGTAIAQKFTKNGWLQLFIGGGLGLAAGYLTNYYNNEKAEQERAIKIKQLDNQLKALAIEEKANEDELGHYTLEWFKTPRFLTPETKPIEESQEQQLNGEPPLVPIEPPNLNEKIISSGQLKQMNFKSLNFTGKWETLVGKPSINFHAVIHGKPGQGKSHLSVQFAKYLAFNFGRVIYISSEEGLSKTLRDKFVFNNAFHKGLHIADLHSFEEVMEELESNTYHFVFVDSLDDMGIDAAKLKILRERFKNSGLITISQSTKSGRARGSQQIIHDCDIAIKVEDGIAFIVKNRFEGNGEYEIFG